MALRRHEEGDEGVDEGFTALNTATIGDPALPRRASMVQSDASQNATQKQCLLIAVSGGVLLVALVFVMVATPSTSSYRMPRVPSQTLVALPAASADLPSCPLPGQQSTATTMVLIRGGEVYAPAPLGRREVLVSGSTIVALLDPSDSLVASLASLDSILVLDATGKVVAPGFVDIHVHVTGGGGEQGPQSRTPKAKVSEMLTYGLTTVVGTLGTDTLTRTSVDLAATVNGINAGSPMTAYFYVGGYDSVGVNTVTGSVKGDISLLAACVGVGEVAMSDHRGSQPSRDQFRNLVAQARLGGLLGGNAGVVYVHMGSGDEKLGPLWDIVHNTPLPISQMLPTHISSRSQALIEDAVAWIDAGGNVDLTAGTKKTVGALKLFFDAGGESALDHVSVSSDCYGSLPSFDEAGRLVRYSYSKPDGLLRLVVTLVLEQGWPLERALKLVTVNPATFTGLKGKGQVVVGGDADLLIMERNSLAITHVVSSGVVAKTADCVFKGFFE